MITRKPVERGSNWRQPSTRRHLFGAATLLLSLGLGVAAAGCGGTDRAEAAFAPVDGTESAYCDTYRAWQVHELDGGTGDDQPNPAAFRAYWKDYLEFNKTSLQQAPAEIRDEWIVSDRAIRTVLTPVLEKYDFDVQRIAKEGTAAEQALGEPTPEVQKAQDAIHAYEDRVCGVATPPAANVAFNGGHLVKVLLRGTERFQPRVREGRVLAFRSGRDAVGLHRGQLYRRASMRWRRRHPTRSPRTKRP